MRVIAHISPKEHPYLDIAYPAAVIAGPSEAEAQALPGIPERSGRARGVRSARLRQAMTCDDAETWAIARFTVLMALLATALVLPPAIAHRLAAGAQQFPGKTLLETIVSLPLVLPPVATGLLLLWLFGRRSPVGRALDAVGIEIIFTWKAVVIAMMVISFPLVARSVRAGIEQVDRRYEQIAATLGAGSVPHPADDHAAAGVARHRRRRGARLLARARRVRRDDHGRRRDSRAARARSRSASTRWSRPAAKTRRGACCWSPRCWRSARSTSSNRLVDQRGPRVIELSIDITLRQGAFVLSVRDAASVEVLGLFGPSGSGKTSLLEAIAGIRTPDAGEIRIGDRDAVLVGAAASTCRRASGTSATCRRTRCCSRTST